MSWRGAWFRAQITGIVFSGMVWLVVAALSLPAAAAALAAGLVWLLGRNTRAGLWWRYGARPANPFERDQVLAAIVPIGSLRGRHQPAIWVGRRIPGSDVVMPTMKALVVSPALVRRIAAREVRDLQVCALVCRALGQQPVPGSKMVAAVDAYSAPWAAVTMVVGAVSRAASRTPLLAASWKIRWLVFALAIINNAHAARWNALFAVAIIATLSGATPYFRARWESTLLELGDERARAEGFGPDLAAMIHTPACSVAELERASTLDRDVSQPRDGRAISREPRQAS